MTATRHADDEARLVAVRAIALVAILALVAAGVLAAYGLHRLSGSQDIPPGVVALIVGFLGIASTCVGILVPSPTQHGGTVTVANTAADPVPVAPAPAPVEPSAG